MVKVLLVQGVVRVMVLKIVLTYVVVLLMMLELSWCWP